MTDRFLQLAARVVRGDVEALDDLGVAERPDDVATDRLPLVDRDAVRRVLTGLRDGLVSQDDAQRWASFVRHGFVPGAAGSPTTPLLVDYDPEDEEAIAEAVDALEAQGDVVDGGLGPDMIDQLLDDLGD